MINVGGVRFNHGGFRKLFKHIVESKKKKMSTKLVFQRRKFELTAQYSIQ